MTVHADSDSARPLGLPCGGSATAARRLRPRDAVPIDVSDCSTAGSSPASALTHAGGARAPRNSATGGAGILW
eukprot:5175243-Prymnesium_polylepis.2